MYEACCTASTCAPRYTWFASGHARVRLLAGTFPSALATGHNGTSVCGTHHIMGSATGYLACSEPQELARKGTRKVLHVHTRPDSPRVVTSSRRAVAVAVLG